MAYDISALTPQEQITALYIAYYDRAPDPGGLAFWTARLEEFLANDNDGDPGLSLGQIADKFAAAAESKAVYPDFLGDSNNDGIADGNNPGVFVTQVYINLFGRLPDTDGLNHWVKNINNGNISPAEALLKIIAGAQGTDIDVLNNKLEVAGDWTQSAIDDGVLNLGPADEAEARSILDGVDETQQSVNDAKDTTDAYFNEAPTAANESDSTNEDTALNGDVSDKTDDADGDTLTHTVEAGDGPSNGTVSMNSDGTYTYTPNANFNGTDSFTYTVDDGNGGTDTGTVFLTVNAINDAPVAQAGIVSTTAEDTAVNGSVSSSDVDGGAPSYSVASGPANGSVTMNPDGTYTYTPDADFNGTDSFAYTVNDGNGGTDTAVVNITINPVDDAPVAQDESATATEDGAVVNGQLDADDIDNNNANITYALNAAAPAGLTVNGDGTYSFDPTVPAYQSLAAGQTQVVVAGYTATSNGKSDTGTITVTVTGTNDAPVAQAVAAAGVEDTVIAGLAVATDVDNGDTLTYSVEAGDGPSNGGVTMNQNGSFEYTPDANFNGTDSFTYTVTDSQGATATATVTLTVAAATDELTAGVDNFQGSVADDIVTGNENTLNAGDSIEGGDGEDTLIVNVNMGLDSLLTFAGFVANVETFQTTIDGPSGTGAVFDMSGSEITGNTFINTNSTADVTYDRVNMNPDGPDADTRTTQLDVELRNVTQGAATTFTTRPAEVVAGDDEANVLMTNLDNNAHIGELSFFGTPGDTEGNAPGTANSGIEVFDLSVMGSPLNVFLNDLNTPGGNTVNIATDTGPGAAGLTIGDENIPGNVGTTVATNLAAGTATGLLFGFENALSNTITTVTSSGDGDVALSLQDDGDSATAARSSGVTGTFDGGNDTVFGSQLNDNLSGGEGNDVLSGAGGNDSLLGQDGNDLLMGDDDTLPAAGNDTLRGGEGQDTLLGGDGNDRLFGDAGNDLIFGEDGNDSLEGGDGNDTISTGDASDASNETVDGGAGNDIVHTRGEQLVGSSLPNFTPKADVLSGGADTDTLIVTMANGANNPGTNGMNDVTQFENIDLNDGNHTYTIDNNSAFDNDSTSVVVDGSDVGKTGADSVNFNAATLSRAITLIGGDGNDTLIGGSGNDTINGDGDQGGSNGGNDVLTGNGGNDTFLGDAYELDGNDTISGGANNDRILVQDRSFGGNSTINNNVTGIETIEVEQNGSGDFTLNIADNFTNGGTTLHVDGSALTNDTLTVNHNNQSENKLTDVDIQITGGAQNDTFNMGETLDAGDTIDGGAGNGDTLQVGSVSNTADADFTNVSNTEVLLVTGAGGGTITLGQAAFDAGITTVNASGASGTITINAANFPGPLTIIDGSGNSTIIGPNSDPLTLQLNGGNDNVTTGSADDVILIDNGDLTGDDTITDNGGDDSIVFKNTLGVGTNIAAVVDLDNVTGIENYDFQTNGNDGFTDTASLTFQGGTVGTVTDININGATVTDTDDSLTILIDGVDNGGLANTVDVDYRFNITGTAGNDRLEKANAGLANQITFDGGAGSDTVAINDGDLGATTTIDGGTGIDWLSQTGGSWTDDDFINVSNVEGLTAESPLVATLGANAAAAGIDRILGTNLNENVLLDAAFTNDLMVDIRQGGDDTINGGASSSTLTFFGRSSSNDITAADILTGGTGTNDSILVDNNGTGTVDLSGTNGVEVVNITETSNGTLTLVLGNTTNDNANNLLTINENSSFNSFFSEGGNPWDGETFNVNGANYNGAILLNGQVGGGGATGNITTSNTGNFNDTINAADGNDNVSTNGGNDVVDGGNGNDTVDAGAGNDSVDGGTGSDNLTGNTGNDTVNGGANDDTIDGGTGIDVLDGGSGNDLIIGGGNEETPNPAVNQGDRMTGGDGNDTFRFFQVSDSRGLDHDVITDWGNGNNTIDIDENVLFQAGGAATSVAFAGNAPNFAQAQGAIAATAGDGVADYIFQAGNAVEAPTLWIDVNDDGTLNAQDIQIELEGFTGTFSGGEVTLSDNATPDAPTILSIDAPAGSDDTGAENDDFITSDTTVTVRVGFSTATDGTGARVGDTVTLNGAPGGSITTAPLVAADITNGYVDIVIPGPLADGTSTLTATVNDTFITTESSAPSASQDLVIDTTVAAPTITSADDDTAGPNGTTADGLTNDNTQTLTGTAEAGASVEVFDGATSLGTVTADGSGNWTFTTAALADGAHSFTAVQTDLAGNVSAASGATNVTVDTLASVTITGIGGEIIDDDIISNPEDTAGGLNFSATATNIEDGQNVTIELFNPSGTSIGSFTPQALAGGAITTFGTVPGVFGPDGTWTAVATVTDQAGNTATDSFDFLVDQTAPAFSVDFATWDSNAQQLILNGTFDGAELTANSGTFDTTAITVDGNGLAAATFVSASDTQIVIDISAEQGALDDGWGNGTNDLVDIAAGLFTDAAGNGTSADAGNATQFDVRTQDGDGTSILQTATVVGQGQDDLIEFDDTLAFNAATGNGGADTFALDNIYDGTDASSTIATITDFDASEGDLIRLDASDVNDEITGSPYSSGDDGAAVAFSTFNSGVVTAATNIEGTLIYDDVNKTLRIDYNGDTSWDGATLTDVGNDDDVIDLTGINGSLTASDIFFVG
jgi:Ca2+-binding RTX toxin-like protein